MGAMEQWTTTVKFDGHPSSTGGHPWVDDHVSISGGCHVAGRSPCRMSARSNFSGSGAKCGEWSGDAGTSTGTAATCACASCPAATRGRGSEFLVANGRTTGTTRRKAQQEKNQEEKVRLLLNVLWNGIMHVAAHKI